MSKKPAKGNAEHALRELNAKIMRLPGSLPLRIERARMLESLGRADEAKKAYADILTRDPKNFSALTNLGMLLYKSGAAVEAYARFKDAAAYHPQSAIAHANVAFMLLKGGDYAAARAQYERALQLDPKNEEAARGLASVLAQTGESAGALNPVVTMPYRGTGTPIRVLLPVTLHAGNIRTDRLLDDRLFAVTKVVVEHCGDSVDVPVHDVIFNAIADADDAPAALARAAALLSSARAPVVNDPQRVASTGRAANAARLAAIPGVRAPRIERFPRASLTAEGLEGSGFSFPLLVRSIGYHGGEHFARIENAGALSAIATLPGEELLVIEFIDTSDAGDLFRKYRAIFVDGEAYPLHLAISHDWKVHYFSSEMNDDAAYREEEAAYLADMRAAIGEARVETLRHIGKALALDYAGADFALGDDGRVVVFEANATMVVPAPPEGAQWAYRRPAIDRIVRAVQEMVAGRAARTLV